MRVTSPDQDFLGVLGVLRLPDPIHRRNEKVRESKYCKGKALLNEPQCIERDAITLMMKAVAAGLDSWASSHSSPLILLPSSCFVRFSAKLEFVLGRFCKTRWWGTVFLWLCLSGWGTVSVLWQVGLMRNDGSKSCLEQVQWVVLSPLYP